MFPTSSVALSFSDVSHARSRSIAHSLTNCGHIDAAFGYVKDKGILVCESIYYEFSLARSEGFENIWRPFSMDFPLKFGYEFRKRFSIDAAYYNPSKHALRVYMGNEHVDYSYFSEKQIPGSLEKNIPIGFVQNLQLCRVENCALCLSDSSKCEICNKGYHLAYAQFSIPRYLL